MIPNTEYKGRNESPKYADSDEKKFILLVSGDSDQIDWKGNKVHKINYFCSNEKNHRWQL